MHRFSEGFAGVKSDKKWGFIDINNNLVIPYEYDFVYSLTEGYIKVEKNKQVGIVDKNNNTIIPTAYNDIYRVGDIFFIYKDNRVGCANMNGQVVVPVIYSNITRFDSYGIAAAYKDRKWGFIDRNNNTIIPFMYKNAEGFEDNYAKFCIKKSWGMIDRNNKIVIPIRYTTPPTTFVDGLSIVTIGRKHGIIDKNGSEIIPIKYDYISLPHEELLCAGNKKDPTDNTCNPKYNYGFISIKDEVVIPFIYNYAYNFYNGLAIVCKGDKWGAINKSNKYVISPLYELDDVINMVRDS